MIEEKTDDKDVNFLNTGKKIVRTIFVIKFEFLCTTKNWNNYSLYTTVQVKFRRARAETRLKLPQCSSMM